MSDVNDIDVDQILSEVNGQSADIPMTSEPQGSPQAAQEPEYEYTARGQTIKEPLSAILKRASQGYDYSQVMNDLNRQKQELDMKFKNYAEVDQFAQQNPDWWNYVVQQYSSRGGQAPASQEQTQEQQGERELPPELNAIKSELDELKQFKNELLQEKNRQMQEAEDAKLVQEIDEIRKQYPNLDLNRVDESGKTLEVKILEHGVQNNIKSFKTAFRDFYHDELVKRAREEGIELAKKDVARKTKLGLLGESLTPTKQLTEATNLKNRSYDDLTKEALAELGLASN